MLIILLMGKRTMCVKKLSCTKKKINKKENEHKKTGDTKQTIFKYLGCPERMFTRLEQISHLIRSFVWLLKEI